MDLFVLFQKSDKIPVRPNFFNQTFDMVHLPGAPWDRTRIVNSRGTCRRCQYPKVLAGAKNILSDILWNVKQKVN